MSLLATVLAILTAVSSCFVGATAYAQPREYEDKTLSPYFFVKSDDPQVDQLPLKSTSAAVNISGVIADVQVAQVYKNEGEKTLEAIYVFPASTRAAVYGMKMTIGKRVIEAKISKREDARKEYEQARQAGKTASLLEQQRPNVFQMNVANILPGDEIKVQLKYTELLVPADRVYEFIYPSVVGPRYSNQPAETAPPSERWVQNAHPGRVLPISQSEREL
jgi:Ca-activated chloride channel family protein